MSTPPPGVPAASQWSPGRILVPSLFVVIAIEIAFVWFAASERRSVFVQVRTILLPQSPQTVSDLRAELGSLVREEQEHETGIEEKRRRVTFLLSPISKLFITVDCAPGSDEINSAKLIYFFSDEVDLETGAGLGWTPPAPMLFGGMVTSLAVAGSWMVLYPRLGRWLQLVGNTLLTITGMAVALVLFIPISAFYLF